MEDYRGEGRWKNELKGEEFLIWMLLLLLFFKPTCKKLGFKLRSNVESYSFFFLLPINFHRENIS
jgi:hypothetical protein